MKRVLFLQPSLQPPGGGNAVAAWMVEALRGHADISLLVWKSIDCDPINRFFGTTLTPSDFTLHHVSPSVRRLIDLIPTPHAMLQMHVMLRRARQLHAERRFDVLVSANNEADFGVRGIQFIHYPWASLPRPKTDLRWFHLMPGVLKGYWKLCGLVSDFSWPRMRSNLTLVNSEYIADKIRQVHAIEPVVVYPPVPGDIPVTPWESRADDFVCVARFNQDKRQDAVIEILEAVRARGHDVRLHLVGSPNREAFARRVYALARERASWVTIHENISRAALVELLARSRYGIHGMIGEHFGIAVAELQRAGCVTFVSEIGGPREIVGPDPRLLYSSTSDAIEKIDRVLRDPEAQRALHAQALARRDLFTTARFVERFRELVRGFES